MPAWTPNTARRLRDPLLKERSRNSFRSSSGAGWLSSQTTKTAAVKRPVADGVEAVPEVFAGVGHRPQHHPQRKDDQGDRQGEQPAPRDQIDQQGREVHAGQTATAPHRRPYADAFRALVLGEGRGDHGQGDRHDHRRGHPGEKPRGEHDLGTGGQTGRPVGQAEQDQADNQNRLAAPTVTDRAQRQEQRGEGERVEIDEPEHLALRGVELHGQFRLGDVQAGDRGDDRHQGDAHRHEDSPPSARVVDERHCTGSFVVHVLPSLSLLLRDAGGPGPPRREPRGSGRRPLTRNGTTPGR